MSRDERTPLLQRWSDDEDTRPTLKLLDHPDEDPRAWPRWRKLANVGVIATIHTVVSPLASSMFTPGISEIPEDLHTSPKAVIATTTDFVILLGIGPLILAPLSETFDLRNIYLICFAIFALLQIPTALAPNIAFLIVVRSVSGFFGSVGIANGGGTISDMFIPIERAGVFGWYLLGPLLGPTLGPLFGGFIVQRLGWRWIFWVMTIVCSVNTLAGYFFLRETYAPVILTHMKHRFEGSNRADDATNYQFEGEDLRPLRQKLAHSLASPAVYQALIFGTTYSIYTNMQDIYSGIYGFSTEKVGLLYLGPGLGFLFAVWFLVPRIDDVYKRLTAKHKDKGQPEFRLPLANIGALFIPVSLFWFAWSVERKVHWCASIVPTFFYGIGQVMILNTTQNYYIDSFEAYAASAIAAGTVCRSIVGGLIPLVAPSLFEKVGYGWGISVFGFVSLALAPAPVLFYIFGERVRGSFALKL
ncbi:MFS general substrate transporter [Paraphaeosphaeria sporulosa]|uniref:MFS general substrate transporter n=1 Tax=Paraphaeosphaeria sporulosa TaxID=1460663 RepID=A0A177CQV3_9PLEO|nr:MFS general substrate transporter [Paraphaeosphaeria sporulosa]OAG09147.1 MFS general substrate transporter [Paraphaeosphaeria sporulosa]